MRPILIILNLLCCGALIAQPAPDFAITDSGGQTHELYADHLNEGKTVVLKLFFTYCPPCNAMAPMLEPFYQSWGGGHGDVEMISLSILTSDLNADVANYKSTHGLTFPGAGGDGGSVAAAQPYTSGTYGTFFGTPTFVVIAPDGTVTFDPRGGSMQATLDSVSVAIANTGANMSLALYNNSGSIRNEDNQGLDDVEIITPNLTIGPPAPQSNPTGYYGVSALLDTEETYTLSAANDDDDYLNGVSTLDQILISRHILGVDTLDSPYKRLAADVDRNEKITTLDVIFLRRLILSIDLELAEQPPWIYVRSDYVFDHPDRPFGEVYFEDATYYTLDPDDLVPLNFIGVKIGDVNNDHDTD